MFIKVFIYFRLLLKKLQSFNELGHYIHPEKNRELTG
jgi:hypothetical protein